ncbi:hypothetical protein ACQY0O_000462 [Thecaphora frezii]
MPFRSAPNAPRPIAQWLRSHLIALPPYVQSVRAAWILLLFYHERVIFDRAATQCQWPTSTAGAPSPDAQDDAFRILLVTDPQIIDPFTYPDLPWPRFTFPLVRHFSDHYLKCVWRSLVLDPHRWSPSPTFKQPPRIPSPTARRQRQRPQLPDAIIWLGDLADGGRRNMDHHNWKLLHDRFDRLFPSPSKKKPSQNNASGQLILTPRQTAQDPLPVFYIPGNHDIGLPAAAAQKGQRVIGDISKQRFIQRYGTPIVTNGYAASGARPTARRSLSARISIAFPDALQSGADAITHELVLINAEDLVGMQRVGGGPFDTRTPPAHKGQLDGPLRSEALFTFPETFDFVERFGKQTTVARTPAPRILFSHVPLYRPEGSMCDHPDRSPAHHVFREASRPLHQGSDRISTYQNLLGEEVSNWLLAQIDPVAVFSGDDHDHCERLHKRVATSRRPASAAGFGSANDVPELTVKSLSMTEGVRRPGFARLSLFPPSTAGANPTVAYVPCLLPDQIGIWTQVYIPALAVSLIVLAWLGKHASRRGGEDGLLPTASSAADDTTKSRWTAQRRYKRRESLDLSDRMGAAPLPGRSRDDVPRTRHGIWFRDVGAVCMVAVPFWLACQASLL